MEIGESIIIGRMGQQPLHLSDASIDPQHATLTRTSADSYVIEDHDSAKGVFVFGLRIMRKTIKADTPLFLGTFKTSVKQLLTDASRINLQQVWNDYDKQKRKWDRYSMLVNSIRMLTPIRHLCWRKGARKEDRRFGHPQRTDANHLRLPALPQISWLRPLLRAKRQKVLP